jgi:hypothetical protein
MPTTVLLLGLAATIMLLGWVYFGRYALPRPPLGVMSLGDVAFMLVMIVLVPFLYLALPLWLVAGLLALATLSALIELGRPVLRPGWVAWPVALALVVADISAALTAGTAHPLFLAVNDLVLGLLIVAITNLWAQSGLRARDTAVLGGALAGYDLVATGLLPLTDALLARLAGLPLMPMVAWSAGDGRWLGIGLGDLLLATVFPLVMRKAFGQLAGLTALLAGLAAIAGMFGVVTSGLLPGAVPAMVILGPLMVAQYALWSRRHGPERTTWQYRQGRAAGPVRGLAR